MARSHLFAALLSALTVGSLVRMLVPTPSRLSARIAPYTLTARSALGATSGAVLTRAPGGLAGRLFVPIIRDVLERAGRLLGRWGDDSLGTRVRQAGLYPHLPERDRLAAYRLNELLVAVGWAGLALLLAAVVSLSTPQVLGLGLLGLVVGAGRQRGSLQRRIDDRRARMRLEIYTIDQLLAMRVRTGGGVIQAVQSLVRRGQGEVVAELGEALRLHRAGNRASECFRRIAELTPEPFCARTYSLLAVAEERGVDLAVSLLALAEDVREARRETMRRAATRRRAAMLIPTIAILAPVMLLFVGAPLPSLLLGFG